MASADDQLFEVDLQPKEVQCLLKYLPHGYSFQLSTKEIKRNRCAQKKYDGYVNEFEYELMEKSSIGETPKKHKTDTKNQTTSQKKIKEPQMHINQKSEIAVKWASNQNENEQEIPKSSQILPQKQKSENQLKQHLRAQAMMKENKGRVVEQKSQNPSDLEAKNQKIMKNSNAETFTNFELCQLILKKLQSHKGSWPFKQPVDPIAQNVPNYFQIVKNPMDLSTVGKKLRAKLYNNDAEFHSDINLIFQNSYLFNSKETVYYNHTKELESYYLQIIPQLKDNPQKIITKKESKTCLQADEYRSNLNKNETTKATILKEKKLKKQEKEKYKNIESSEQNERSNQNFSGDKKIENKTEGPLESAIKPLNFNTSETLNDEKSILKQKKKIPTVERQILFNKIQTLSQQNIKDLLNLVFEGKVNEIQEQFQIDIENMSRQKYESIKSFVNEKSQQSLKKIK